MRTTRDATMTRRPWMLLMPALVLVAAMFASPVAAQAETSIEPFASSRCQVGSSGNCTTAIIAANASGHFLDLWVDNTFRWKPCPWRVRDVTNGQIVRSGTVPSNSRTDQVVQGVYSFYQLELRGCLVSAEGYLDNT